MPRGKNYVNNNRGVSLQAPKKGQRMVACIYGAGCTRGGCIYSHPRGKGTKEQGKAEIQSKEPCMSFLAGVCMFSAGGCRKKHPSKAEADRLVVKYRATKCRFGDACMTRGCLYLHTEEEETGAQELRETPAYITPAPLSPAVALGSRPIMSSAWKPSMPGLPAASLTPGHGSLQFSTAAFVPQSTERQNDHSASARYFSPQSAMPGHGELSMSSATFVPQSTGNPHSLSASSGEFVPQWATPGRGTPSASSMSYVPQLTTGSFSGLSASPAEFVPRSVNQWAEGPRPYNPASTNAKAVPTTLQVDETSSFPDS